MNRYKQMNPKELQNICGGTLLGVPDKKVRIGRIPYPKPVKPKFEII